MKRICIMAMVLCFVCTACEKDYSGLITASYPVDGYYTDLEVSHAFEVVVCDTVSKAMVSVRGGEHKNVIFKVEDGTLKIGFKSTLFNWIHGPAKVLLPRNNALCDVELSGASSFHGDLQGDKIEMEISGSSKVSGFGSCNELLDMEISGSSDVDAYGLECRSVAAKVSGSSKVKISSCESIMGSLSGSSDLYYKALPGCNPVVNCSTSGGSKVHQQ